MYDQAPQVTTNSSLFLGNGDSTKRIRPMRFTSAQCSIKAIGHFFETVAKDGEAAENQVATLAVVPVSADDPVIKLQQKFHELNRQRIESLCERYTA